LSGCEDDRELHSFPINTLLSRSSNSLLLPFLNHKSKLKLKLKHKTFELLLPKYQLKRQLSEISFYFSNRNQNQKTNPISLPIPLSLTPVALTMSISTVFSLITV
jgi:hypothetical protein